MNAKSSLDTFLPSEYFFDETCAEYEEMMTPNTSMSAKYPKYYKPVGELTEIDVYATHKLFNVNDPSGAIQHASKKLLLSGSRTGGKSEYDDIREARDTLTRWLELFPEKDTNIPF